MNIWLVIYLVISFFVFIDKYSSLSKVNDEINSIPTGDMEYHEYENTSIVSLATILFFPALIGLVICSIFSK